MKRDKGNIILTLKEAEDIMNLLYSLEATGGVYDEEYTKDAKMAGRYGNKLLKCITTNYETDSRRSGK